MLNSSTAQTGGWTAAVSALCRLASHPSQRSFAASADDKARDGTEAGPGPASEGPASTPSLAELLQASGSRLAEGGAAQLANMDADLAAAAVQARLRAALGSGPESASAESEPGTSDALDAAAADSGADPDAPVTAGQKLRHARYGYAALGGSIPDPAPSSASIGTPGASGSMLDLVGRIQASSPRINPKRRFQPGETYEPQDLNPYAPRTGSDRRRRNALGAPRPSAEEVLQKADFKNAAFLSSWFLTPAGRIAPRTTTRLPVALHQRVSRHIRLARHLALIPGESRLDKAHLPRLRAQELAAAQAAAAAAQQGGGGGAGPGLGLEVGLPGPGAGAKEGGPRRRYNELLDFGA
ncbi:hypothetical protein HYH03_014181 [Edaphochlamys debaryana]|uniref:Small ribosomal subunit protein bS18c n=1 Tax=Edaphochlamys debaryana TaxID=47281 RepID=A0A835XPK3_9CHLO|nr:hypothetical protein HYH03_014181 [Edaphochlamys debaryana]|eukprot:KAG2487207.1 hypothetical protein HYH03_014181 [Edaphochlamys debaryana]